MSFFASIPCESFEATEAAGYAATELRAAGYSLSGVKTAGYSATDLKTACFDASVPIIKSYNVL